MTTDPLYIDGCFVAHWESDRGVLEAMRRGGVAAANCNRVTWEGFHETMRLLARYKGWLDGNADVARLVREPEDVLDAQREGRVGIILGFQNASPLDDELPLLRLFVELGLRVLQLTYSTASSVGGGCWESHDLPLTDFGHDLVAEANRLGLLIDLSHCSARTTADAIRASSAPVAFTHVCPAALKPHPRSKSDEELRAVAATGGVAGLTFDPVYLRAGAAATADDYLEALEHALRVAGEEHVAIGTDFTLGIGDTAEYIARDKGYGRYYIPGWDTARFVESTTAAIPAPLGLRSLASQRDDLVAAMARRGWPDERIRRVLGLNWLRVFGDVWKRSATREEEACWSG
jgi:membrane dipeptidase